MELKELFGIIALILTFVSGIIYYAAILRGKTRPHLYTRVVFAIVESIIFFGQFAAGGGMGSWVTGATALLTIGIVILCLRYGTKDVTKSDGIALTLALICIVIWAVVEDPLWAVLFAVFIDFWAIIPTFRKTWNAPQSESLWAWSVAQVKWLFAIFALSTFSLTTLIYPIEVLIANGILIFIILYRRNRKSTR
jgi:hypothetical protein